MKKENIEKAKIVRLKLHSGDRIEDDELEKAIKVYEIVCEFLMSDPHLHLAWKELNFDLMDLKSFQFSRKHH